MFICTRGQKIEPIRAQNMRNVQSRRSGVACLTRQRHQSRERIAPALPCRTPLSRRGIEVLASAGSPRAPGARDHREHRGCRECRKLRDHRGERTHRTQFPKRQAQRGDSSGSAIGNRCTVRGTSLRDRRAAGRWFGPRPLQSKTQSATAPDKSD